MVRRLLFAALVLLSGCGVEVAPAAEPLSPWSATDSDGWEFLRKLRHVDACALLGPAELGEIGPVLQENRPDLDRCEYQLTSLDQADRTLVTAAITTSSARAGDGETTRAESGATVFARAGTETRHPVASPGHTAGTCVVRAVFPSSATLVLDVRTPSGDDSCSVADHLLGPALKRFRVADVTQPQPRSPSSVLDSADPCAVRTRIDITVEVDAQEPYRCSFTYRGARLQVVYSTETDDPSAPRTDIAGWPVFYRESTSGDRDVVAVALVDGVRIDRAAVTVRGPNRDVVGEIMGLTLGSLPPR